MSTVLCCKRVLTTTPPFWSTLRSTAAVPKELEPTLLQERVAVQLAWETVAKELKDTAADQSDEASIIFLAVL